MARAGKTVFDAQVFVAIVGDRECDTHEPVF
jgi:hypothetical protein